MLFYMRDFLLCAAVEGEEGLFFLAYEHEAVVIVALIVGGQFNVGDDVVIEFVLNVVELTCSSLVLNQSLALPYLTGMN